MDVNSLAHIKWKCKYHIVFAPKYRRKIAYDGGAYIVADNAAMILSGEFTDDGDVLESTVRGIKLEDSIDKVFESYGPADKYDTCTKEFFSHDNLKDTDQYTYFLKIDSTKDYFYAFTFYVDQYSDVIGVLIEPIPMKYWSED